MRVREIIEKADSLYPNIFPFVTKALWLSELDKKVCREFLDVYGDTSAVFPEDCTSPDRELVIEDTFSEIYLRYLFMQFDLTGENITGYQNQASLFNTAYLSFMNHYNRNHTIAARRIKID